MEREGILIYGAGGHAREMAAHVPHVRREGGEGYHAEAFVEDGVTPGRSLCGLPVIPGDVFERDYRSRMVVVAIGDPEGRRQVVERCAKAGHKFPALVHSSVDIAGVREIGEGAVIFRGSMLTVDIRIGRHVHLNIGCTVSHDAVIDDFATLSPGVRVAGNVHIGAGAFLGIGASVINGSASNPLSIAPGSMIAAGACVTTGTEPNCLYAGVPARMKKRYR